MCAAAQTPCATERSAHAAASRRQGLQHRYPPPPPPLICPPIPSARSSTRQGLRRPGPPALRAFSKPALQTRTHQLIQDSHTPTLSIHLNWWCQAPRPPCAGCGNTCFVLGWTLPAVLFNLCCPAIPPSHMWQGTPPSSTLPRVPAQPWSSKTPLITFLMRTTIPTVRQGRLLAAELAAGACSVSPPRTWGRSWRRRRRRVWGGRGRQTWVTCAATTIA